MKLEEVKQRFLQTLQKMKQDDRPEITQWLISKDYTKGWNEALQKAMERAGALWEESFSEQIKRQTVEENNLGDPYFKGDTYEKAIDQKALTKDLFKVFAYMVENTETFLTDVEIAEATGAYLPSIPRFRCYLKSPEYGSHNMLRRPRPGSRLYEHKIIPNKESLTYHAWLNHSAF